MSNGENDDGPQDGDDVVWVDTEVGSDQAARFTMETVVSKLGVSADALLRYEALGLLNPLSYGKVRVYGQNDCDCLALIVRDHHLSKSLDRIAHMLEDPTAHPTPKEFERGREWCENLIVRLEKQRSDISSILAHLRRVYTLLTLKAGSRPGPR